LPPTWNESGLDANFGMIEDFVTELREQGILQSELTPHSLFPFEARRRAGAA
jgi:4,5-dihydroxyphthalate decarboxylase